MYLSHQVNPFLFLQVCLYHNPCQMTISYRQPRVLRVIQLGRLSVTHPPYATSPCLHVHRIPTGLSLQHPSFDIPGFVISPQYDNPLFRSSHPIVHASRLQPLCPSLLSQLLVVWNESLDLNLDAAHSFGSSFHCYCSHGKKKWEKTGIYWLMTQINRSELGFRLQQARRYVRQKWKWL